MSALRILAPILVDFHVVPGSNLREPAQYARFWQSAQSLCQTLWMDVPLAERPELFFHHASRFDEANLYQDISRYSGGTTKEIFSGSIPAKALDLSRERTLDGLLPIESVRFDTFDHGLMLLDVVVPLELYRASLGFSPKALDDLESWAVEMGERISRAVERQVIAPVVGALRRAQPRFEVLEPAASNLSDPRELGRPLWVTRSLYLEPSGETIRPALRHWLSNTGPASESIADSLADGSAGSSVMWLNYAFISPSPTEASAGQEACWAGLRQAQYFYGALDRIDTLLARVLAESGAESAPAQLERLRRALMRLSRRAEQIVMDRQRVSRYLPRDVRKEMDRILDTWDHDRLLQEPVNFKVEVCHRQLAELERRRSARAGVVTDLILLCIGITSILATALAISDFGRETALDPRLTGMDGSGLVGWIAAQPADAILVASTVISLAAIGVYFYFRSHSES